MKKPRLNVLYFICMILLLIVCIIKLFSLFLSPLIEETILLGGVWAFLALASFFGALFSFRKKQEGHIKKEIMGRFLRSNQIHIMYLAKERKNQLLIYIGGSFQNVKRRLFYLYSFVFLGLLQQFLLSPFGVY